MKTIENLLEKIDQVPFPSRKEIEERHLKTFYTAIGTLEQLQNLEKVLKEKAKKEFREKRNEYHTKRNQLWSEVKSLVEKNCFETLPQREALDAAWKIAWDNGHDEGYQSVIDKFEELTEILQYC